MTTIFYDGENLHADRRVMYHCHPSRISDDGVKLFRNEKNNMALGISGNLPDDKYLIELFDCCEIMFKLIYHKIMKSKIEFSSFPDDILKIFKKSDFYIIAITSNKCFMCKDGFVYPQTGFMAAIGAGHRSIIGSYYVVKDVATAFRLSSEIETLSSPEYISIMANTLTPYVMEQLI